MAALTKLSLLGEPKLLVRTSLMPAASTTARTAPPAITPVPGLAGIIRTVAAPKRPMTVWGMVEPLRLIRFICFWASLTPFSTAGGTSLALP